MDLLDGCFHQSCRHVWFGFPPEAEEQGSCTSPKSLHMCINWKSPIIVPSCEGFLGDRRRRLSWTLLTSAYNPSHLSTEGWCALTTGWCIALTHSMQFPTFALGFLSNMVWESFGDPSGKLVNWSNFNWTLFTEFIKCNQNAVFNTFASFTNEICTFV